MGTAVNAPVKTGRYVGKRQPIGCKLAYYRADADAAYWDEYWKSIFDPKTYYASADRGSLGVAHEKIWTRYLLKQKKILEAGCSLGRYLVALRVRGYDVDGVEWGADTVCCVLAVRPEIPICVSDITALDVPDEFYAGYISIGVVEYRFEGPSPFFPSGLPSRIRRHRHIYCPVF